MITKPQFICDGCEQPIAKDATGTVSFTPIRGGLFLELKEPDLTVEHRLVQPVHFCGASCFTNWTAKLIATARQAAAPASAAK